MCGVCVIVVCVYRELSAQIDADVERRKELEAIRVGGAHPPLHTPTYHNMYTTLKNNRRITRLQVCVCVRVRVCACASVRVCVCECVCECECECEMRVCVHMHCVYLCILVCAHTTHIFTHIL